MLVKLAREIHFGANLVMARELLRFFGQSCIPRLLHWQIINWSVVNRLRPKKFPRHLLSAIRARDYCLWTVELHMVLHVALLDFLVAAGCALDHTERACRVLVNLELGHEDLFLASTGDLDKLAFVTQMLLNIIAQRAFPVASFLARASSSRRSPLDARTFIRAIAFFARTTNHHFEHDGLKWTIENLISFQRGSAGRTTARSSLLALFKAGGAKCVSVFAGSRWFFLNQAANVTEQILVDGLLDKNRRVETHGWYNNKGLRFYRVVDVDREHKQINELPPRVGKDLCSIKRASKLCGLCRTVLRSSHRDAIFGSLRSATQH